MMRRTGQASRGVVSRAQALVGGWLGFRTAEEMAANPQLDDWFVI
jgi:hypothetical protein